MDDVKAVPEKSLSQRERRRKQRENMSAEERAYLRRKSVKDRVWPFFRFVILVGLSFVILYPLIYMISCAFRERGDMSDPTVMWIPRHYTLDIIRETIDAMDYWETLKNTVLLNIGCSLVQVVACAITGYGFARFKFKGKKLLFGIVIMMILVPTQVISLPLYTQFRYFGIKGLFSVNLIDSRLTMYLPAMTANGIRAGLMILIFRQFFKGLPRELEDAAYIDGCGPFMTFVKVMAPNAAPAFLTVFLFSVVWYWNDYYVSNTFFTAPKTVALMLTNLDSQLKIKLFNDPSVQISLREQIVWKEAGCLLSIAPVLLMYVFLQKHFTEGIERSGIVG
ncbi:MULTISPECIES: carbohydrate ABC transporter permease [Ruminococcus]|uniref:Multiple sugar transport system permease protein n=1 Tax=Ruminococcus flavefaciens TaxID=1265 RepID=A0A1M7KSV2_RUMFL|nr:MULTISPECIES: carbohydrate ABC transporter permease [Ruminococcus]MCR4795588.1 carbohydrate ABC transporter permease [Ruminococcus sp.]SHM68628.1 multiple sugar transport system permease protein [Ruminococcus flavefaciens]